jgi:hypothetical protein
MGKRFAIINPTSNIIFEIVEIEDTADIETSRPGATAIQLPKPGPGTFHVYPGMLYFNNRFWQPSRTLEELNKLIPSAST